MYLIPTDDGSRKKRDLSILRVRSCDVTEVPRFVLCEVVRVAEPETGLKKLLHSP